MHFYIDQLLNGKVALINDSGRPVQTFNSCAEALAAYDHWDTMPTFEEVGQIDADATSPAMQQAAA